jgi:uncharacterized protein (TIGR02145 family)
MISNKNIRIIEVIIIGFALFGCKSEEVVLHGDISGTITDSRTNQPVAGALLTANPSGDTVTTRIDGYYILKNLTPGGYEITVSKQGYGTNAAFTTIGPAETMKIDFPLNPLPAISVPALDFGGDLTSLNFRISNSDSKRFSYILTTSKPWIDVKPAAGDLTEANDTITVTIDRTTISDSIQREKINLAIYSQMEKIGDIEVKVFINGVMDEDENYYRIVKIAAQTWMAENLNVGISVPMFKDQTDNNIIEKYSFYNEYGGLYQWKEMMQYGPSDSKPVGTTRGICPVGWHIPTISEWQTLVNFAGGQTVAGKMLKEKGSKHWYQNSSESYPRGTDYFGFTALPGGWNTFDRYDILRPNNYGRWWSSSESTITLASGVQMGYDSDAASFVTYSKKFGFSVRCVKDPVKK